ncbi:hypothetical protein DC3_33580 [Deinococcus cellulosilyticus NBRC 106333 = KACC 11606]|uniref:Uncharacterized protein n=1 Tax=Deinococcus cellulosilyticus (strain DSM 18568 / NBRC 106333 / KACC 11606 / 5516J-15) TaxID=1223518 RepID=A0A511N4C2_DEIC1|nr:hypothetical protein DC3_33580 [Deinococcus cellulosilyticus NBRC 106333 = KACC 11606]
MAEWHLPVLSYPFLLLAALGFRKVGPIWALLLTVFFTFVAYQLIFISPLLPIFAAPLIFLALVGLLACVIQWLMRRPVSPWVLGPSLVTCVVAGCTLVLYPMWCFENGRRLMAWWC